MTFVVTYDACALHSNTGRDLLIRVAQMGLVQAKWSSQILDELVESLDRRGIGTPDGRKRLRELIADSVADSMVVGHEKLIDALVLPDPDDRHVLAAAVRSHSQVIVTENLKDFPADALAEWNIEAKTPDDFVRDLIDIDAWIVNACVQQIVDSRTHPPMTFGQVLEQLERCGFVQSANALRLGPPS